MAAKQQKGGEELAGVEVCMGLRTHKRSGEKGAHVATVRARRGCLFAARPANMMVQQPSKMAHARE